MDTGTSRRSKHPLEVRHYPYGWTVTFYGEDGHVRHLVNASSEIRAFRAAFNLSRLYHQNPIARVITPKGEYVADLARILHGENTSK